MFRFDYIRDPKNHYPTSHLHIYGKWLQGEITKALPKIHFPVPRSTLEGVLRLLVYEFDITPNEKAEDWLKILHHTEKRFLQIARTKTQRRESELNTETI